MAKQLKSNMTGAVADIIGETRKYYWVLSRKTGEPFTVLKGNNHWVPYTPKPEVGDVWAPTPEGAHYRILGVSEKAGLWHMCLADQWHGGKYPKPKDGIQVDPAKEVRVFTRSYPDILDWVFIERPES